MKVEIVSRKNGAKVWEFPKANEVIFTADKIKVKEYDGQAGCIAFSRCDYAAVIS